MEPIIKLSLNSSEMQSLVMGLQELQRAVGYSAAVNDAAMQEQNARITSLLVKMDVATQQAIQQKNSAGASKISGGQRLANLTHEFVADVSLLSSEYNFCLACALGAAVQMLALSANTMPHNPAAGEDETEIAEQFVHAPGRA